MRCDIIAGDHQKAAEMALGRRIPGRWSRNSIEVLQHLTPKEHQSGRYIGHVSKPLYTLAFPDPPSSSPRPGHMRCAVLCRPPWAISFGCFSVVPRSGTPPKPFRASEGLAKVWGLQTERNLLQLYSALELLVPECLRKVHDPVGTGCLPRKRANRFREPLDSGPQAPCFT